LKTAEAAVRIFGMALLAGAGYEFVMKGHPWLSLLCFFGVLLCAVA
jgi:hypothetical protein